MDVGLTVGVAEGGHVGEGGGERVIVTVGEAVGTSATMGGSGVAGTWPSCGEHAARSAAMNGMMSPDRDCRVCPVV